MLARLMEDSRLQRMDDWQTTGTYKDVYGVIDLMDDIRKGVWTELGASGSVVIDPYRRSLQHAYIAMLAAKLAAGTETPMTIRPIVRGELMDTKAAIKLALSHTTDRATKLHLMDANDTIQLILYPKGG